MSRSGKKVRHALKSGIRKPALGLGARGSNREMRRKNTRGDK